MNLTRLAIPDVLLLEPEVFGDARGFLMETWNRRRFGELGLDVEFVQDNHSRSVRWTLRGLHYQIRQPQGKLVRVVAGEVLDVAVDLRQGSPTFGRWVSHRLSHDDPAMVWIPPGFAHGFLVLSETAELIYKCSDYYAPEHERCIRWDDAALAIDWEIPTGVEPILSEKDARGATLDAADTYADMRNEHA